ncbi:MAG TPA: AarF/ABC1/UbiB kinase family protein [Acidimicrobiales bacterium]
MSEPVSAASLSSFPDLHTVDLDGVSASVIERSKRLAQITVVALRYLVPAVLTTSSRNPEQRATRLGGALRKVVDALGVTFVKLGQLLASSPSLAGEHLSNAMRGVLDDGRPVPTDAVRRTIEADLGCRIDEIFSELAPQPFAAASLAVVHRGRLRDGTDVAVKVLRPGAATVVATDLGLIQPMARWLAGWLPVGMVPAIPQLLDGLATQLTEELDLRNEAHVMDWYRQVLGLMGATEVIVPEPMWSACGPNVLTMEFVEGSTIDDLASLSDQAVDTTRAIQTVLESWFATTLCTGVFHGDMHAGNLLVTAEGRVALLDWGIVGRLPEASRVFFRRSIEGALGDESAWPDVVAHMRTFIDDDVLTAAGITLADLEQVIRAQTLMIMTSPFSEIDLMMLAPPTQSSLPGQERTSLSLVGWLKLARQERRKLRQMGLVGAAQAPPHSELLLIKQLIFFERYGKLFLADRPLIFDPELYRSLLALPDLRGSEVT